LKIFLIDDEASIRIGLGDDLRDRGHLVFDYENPIAALQTYAELEPDCILCDLRMPAMDGFTFLNRIREIDPVALVVIISAFGDVATAVKCLKAGAMDFLTKPFEPEDLQEVLQKVGTFAQLRRAARQATPEALLPNFLGSSPRMAQVFQEIRRIAPTDGLVLIEGETGTGKERVADAIHQLSSRKDGPLVKISCSIFSKDLLESELFGHEQGAFTGAMRQKRGRIEMAEGGTLFLDEVDDLSLEIQIKLLRFLQEKTFERVGGETVRRADVRVIAATKRDLQEMMDEGDFRPDLYYRLNVFPIRLPPLRDRKEDIPMLAGHFLEEFIADRSVTLTPEAMERLMAYRWPGNVRQLRHVMERISYTLDGNHIGPAYLPAEVAASADSPIRGLLQSMPDASLEQVLWDVERNLLVAALEAEPGNRKAAARRLQIPYSTLRHKLEKFKLPFVNIFPPLISLVLTLSKLVSLLVPTFTSYVQLYVINGER
jgi:DNA-binding NtrC family response regulator